VGRLGASILQGLGHPEWIARAEDEYVEITVKLAHDSNHLARVRAGLRHQMQESCLMDETGFTRDLEQVYREMFRAWAVAAPRPGLA
jgi:predicted O-linked N-acetylglucosamine transferase (SPINDLY family)